MIYRKLGTVVCASAVLIGGCGILETVEIPEIHFDSNTYVVQPGDTVQSVADRYNIDPQSLVAANSLSSNQLDPGQRLTLVRSDRVAARGRVVADEPVAMIPVNNQDPQFTSVNEQAVPVGPVVTIPPREEIVAVKVPGQAPTAGATDSLLDDTPVVAALPDAPGAIPALKNAEVINNDVVADVAGRPQGTETIIQSVDAAAKPNMVEIPAANTSLPGPVKTVTVNTRANGWNWPALGKITRDFDLSEINRQGLDIDAGPGAGVQAAADGEVVYSGRDLASYGNLVILRHKDNFLSAYSKVSDIFVKENQKVKAGELIAVVGDAADEGTELHFEIRRNGEPVNPVEYLPAL